MNDIKVWRGRFHDWHATCEEHLTHTEASGWHDALEAAYGHAALWHKTARVAVSLDDLVTVCRVIDRATSGRYVTGGKPIGAAAFDHPGDDWRATPPLSHDYEVPC